MRISVVSRKKIIIISFFERTKRLAATALRNNSSLQACCHYGFSVCRDKQQNNSANQTERFCSG
jgi:hypothetical protein